MKNKPIMTRKGFYLWEQRIAAFLRENNIDSFSPDEEGYEEFVVESCDCCGTPLAGARYSVRAYDHKAEDIAGPWSVCTDCLFYNEYGHIGDGHMRDIRDDAIRCSRSANLTLRLIRRGWERLSYKHPGPTWNTLVDTWNKGNRILRVITDRDYDTIVHVEKVEVNK